MPMSLPMAMAGGGVRGEMGSRAQKFRCRIALLLHTTGASDDLVTSFVRSVCHWLERQLPSGLRTRQGMAPFHGALRHAGLACGASLGRQRQRKLQPLALATFQQVDDCLTTQPSQRDPVPVRESRQLPILTVVKIDGHTMLGCHGTPSHSGRPHTAAACTTMLQNARASGGPRHVVWENDASQSSASACSSSLFRGPTRCGG